MNVAVESTSTASIGLGEGAWTPTSAGTMAVSTAIEPERPRRSAWRETMKVLVVATLPIAGVYDPPRRWDLNAAFSHHALILGGDDLGHFDVDPESVLAVMPRQPTLWIHDAVPILPPRRPFISALNLLDEDE
jgi:hypothetical protein